MDRKFTNIPELWGGIECSFNRVNNRYFDQLQYAGHYNRIESDIEAFASTSVRAMRYPVIWERLQPSLNTSISWQQTAIALNALRRRKINPIAGLVHHGSGPRYAEVRNETFPLRLASFAKMFAAEFPWVEYYTPVNEPLTTARFSGLYGLWFPHKRNDSAFVKILLNELKGVVLAMKAIRQINPDAKLIQTEDLAKIYSTPLMKYQADFENERRWLTFDILCGKLKPGHALWWYFTKYATTENDLFFFVDNPCSPDIIGLDYYPTSERYLDENIDKYPPERHGHNHRHRYADVEALRVKHDFDSGAFVLIKEVWDRYHLPIAITEVHINCDHENQIRWFAEIRNTCRQLMALGVDIRAITAWAMMGSFGWNRLLTVDGGDYEAGAFGLRDGELVATPLASYLRQLSQDPEFIHPAEQYPGWWKQPSRLIFETKLEANPVLLNEHCIE
ncbi:MAG TPA: family 1 glycosylhydrolase [Chryseosolibacter sp.]|nr:family 1 glycosylhydrolase [Chryseosolibacter sp.]